MTAGKWGLVGSQDPLELCRLIYETVARRMDATTEGPRVQLQYATETPALPESAVAVPLRLGEHTIGLMSVQSYSRNAYDVDDLHVLEGRATEAAIVIAGLYYSEPCGRLQMRAKRW